MTQSTSRPHAESILRFLKQRSEQLEVFHSGNARLIVQQFLDFFDRDDICAFISNALQRRVDTPVKKWIETALRESKVPPMPATAVGCMAFRHATLRLVRMDKLDLRHFATNLFPGSFLDEKLMHWKRLIVHPFGSDCRTLADLLIARLPQGDWVDMTALVDEVLDGPFAEAGFGPRAWDDEDDRKVEDAEGKKKKKGAAPPAPAPALAATATPAGATTTPAAGQGPRGDESSALDALERSVREASLADAVRGDLLLDVAALRLEARRPTRAGERIAARLDDMAEHAPVSEACARARAALA